MIIRILFLLLLITQNVSAQSFPSNIVRGLVNWKSVLLAPDPMFMTGTSDGPQDHHCQVTAYATQITMICAVVPDPITGYWNPGFRMVPYTGHVTNTWPLAGFELGVESTGGSEFKSRVYLWDFKGQRTIWFYGNDNPDIFAIGQYDKPIMAWITGPMQSESWVHSKTGFSTQDINGIWMTGMTRTIPGIGTFVNGILVQ